MTTLFRISVRLEGEIVRSQTGTKPEIKLLAEMWRKQFLLQVIVGTIPPTGNLIFIEEIPEKPQELSSKEACLPDQKGGSVTSEPVKPKVRRRNSYSENDRALAYERSGKHIPIEAVRAYSSARLQPVEHSSYGESDLARAGREFALRFK